MTLPTRGTIRRLASRLTALVLLALGLGLATLAVLVPAFDRHASAREEIETELRHLARFRAVAESQRAEIAATLASRSIDAGDLVAGASEPIAAAALQSQLKALAEPLDVRLLSTSTLPPRDLEALRLIGARIKLQAPIEAVQALLHAVERARPRLVIDRVGLASIIGIDGRETVLDVEADVFAAYVGRGSAADGTF